MAVTKQQWQKVEYAGNAAVSEKKVTEWQSGRRQIPFGWPKCGKRVVLTRRSMDHEQGAKRKQESWVDMVEKKASWWWEIEIEGPADLRSLGCLFFLGVLSPQSLLSHSRTLHTPPTQIFHPLSQLSCSGRYGHIALPFIISIIAINPDRCTSISVFSNTLQTSTGVDG